MHLAACSALVHHFGEILLPFRFVRRYIVSVEQCDEVKSFHDGLMILRDITNLTLLTSRVAPTAHAQPTRGRFVSRLHLFRLQCRTQRLRERLWLGRGSTVRGARAATVLLR